MSSPLFAQRRSAEHVCGDTTVTSTLLTLACSSTIPSHDIPACISMILTGASYDTGGSFSTSSGGLRDTPLTSVSRSGTIVGLFWEQARGQLQDFKMAVFHLATPAT